MTDRAPERANHLDEIFALKWRAVPRAQIPVFPNGQPVRYAVISEGGWGGDNTPVVLASDLTDIVAEHLVHLHNEALAPPPPALSGECDRVVQRLDALAVAYSYDRGRFCDGQFCDSEGEYRLSEAMNKAASLIERQGREIEELQARVSASEAKVYEAKATTVLWAQKYTKDMRQAETEQARAVAGITRLSRELAEARAALKPFAKAYDEVSCNRHLVSHLDFKRAHELTFRNPADGGVRNDNS